MVSKSAAATHRPDIVLLLAGANDLWQLGNNGVANATVGLRDIIRDIRTVVPGVTILLGLTHPYVGPNSEFIEPLNEAIASVASELDTTESPLILVDHYTGFDMESMLGINQIHHNRVGEAWVAENWFEVLASILPDSEPFQINVGHSGAWYNSETSGQGQLIDVEPVEQYMFLAWFTFTAAASNNPDQLHWYTAQGNYSGNTAELILNETLGGLFDNPQQISTNPVGTVILSFTDCERGQMAYSIDTDGRQGTIPLQRLMISGQALCEELAGAD